MESKRKPGDRIASLRQTYAVSREALAERSGVPADLIGRMEDEGFIPDLAPLVRISRALGVRLGTLLDDHEELGPVVTRGGEAAASVRFVTGAVDGAELPHRGLSFRSLAARKGGRHMEPFIVDVHASSDPGRSTHEGEEFLLVLSGTVVIEYGAQRFELSEGDTIYYDSIVPHRVLASGGGPAKMLAVVYAPL